MILLPKAIQKSRNVLPKTGQIISYFGADDGDLEAGWWRKRLNANNKTRFVSKIISGDAVVLDYATRLMWRPTQEVLLYNWANAFAKAASLTYGGFTDWKVPNLFELFTISNLGNNITYYTDFFTISEDFLWTSTTFPIVTTAIYILSLNILEIQYCNSLDIQLLLPCREF
jgi:hypothetical protein